MMTDLQIQCILRYLGYRLVVDGITGKETGDAIESFQRDNNLTHDRVFGPDTEAKARFNFNNDVFRPVQSSVQDSTVITPIVQTDVPTSVKTGSTGTFWDEIRYFTRTEFRCPCGKWCNGFPVEPKEKLVRFMDKMRSDMGRSIIIVPPDGHSGGSGVRCEKYNATLSGSATNSTHKEGRACDFSIPGVSAATINAYLQSAKNRGEIAYFYQISATSFHVNI